MSVVSEFEGGWCWCTVLVRLYKLENHINQLIQEIFIMWCYMILKKEEECNMSQVFIEKCQNVPITKL